MERLGQRDGGAEHLVRALPVAARRQLRRHRRQHLRMLFKGLVVTLPAAARRQLRRHRRQHLRMFF